MKASHEATAEKDPGIRNWHKMTEAQVEEMRYWRDGAVTRTAKNGVPLAVTKPRMLGMSEFHGHYIEEKFIGPLGSTNEVRIWDGWTTSRLSGRTRRHERIQVSTRDPEDWNDAGGGPQLVETDIDLQAGRLRVRENGLYVPTRLRLSDGFDSAVTGTDDITAVAMTVLYGVGNETYRQDHDID